MFEFNSSSCLPQLHPIALTDWLPKLGDKAFLAWLHFHSWKPLHYSSETGILLPFSLNKIIRKLGVGKATFYEKIIQPLESFGLIKVVESEYSKQENNLVVFMYPHNLEENATRPLCPLTIQETDWTDSCCNVEPVSNENSQIIASKTIAVQTPICSNPEPAPVPHENSFDAPSIPVQSKINDNNIKEKDLINQSFNQSSNQSFNQSSADEQIPEELAAILKINPLFCERTDQILKVFYQCKSHPGYTLASFLTMLKRCIFYPHDPKYFSFYLQKSLLNEWAKKLSVNGEQH